MTRYYFESFVGFCVLLTASLLAWVFFSRENFYSFSESDIVKVEAYFNTVAGINRGADVKLAGVKIGTISNVRLDPDSFLAVLEIQISSDCKIPNDSTFVIKSDGLMGGKFVAVSTGISPETIKTGMVFKDNQSSLDLEGVIGQAMFGGKEKK